MGMGMGILKQLSYLAAFCTALSKPCRHVFFQRPRVYTERWQDVTNVQCGVAPPLKFRAVIGQGRSSSVIG